MTTSPSTDTIIPNRYSIPIFLALIAAGLAGNYFNFQIFLNISFLFGGIFAMLTLQFFGLGPGILAAAMISSYTYILWNNPYGIIMMIAEVAVVGWLIGRRKMGMVLADTLYWLIIGMPLVYFFYHVVMHSSFSSTSIVITKQAVNGIANALVARLIFTGFALRSRSSLISYREIIYNLLTFFVLCPALIMLAVDGRNDFNETDSQMRTTLIEVNRHITDRLETWVVNRKTTIVNLAEMAASQTPQQMQPYLELIKKSDVNFLRIGLIDREAITTAFYPLVNEQGKSNIGLNFADHPFIPMLKQTLKPMLSDVHMGMVDTSKPIVVILAPVVISGEYGGFIAGALNLEQIREFLVKNIKANDVRYTLVDKNGNVIMTNRTDQTAMKPFVRGEGTLNHLDEEINQWTPTLPPDTPLVERWKKSFYIAETAIGNTAGWKLVLEQPVAPFQKTFNDNYTKELILLFLILFVALALAELLSRRIVVTLEKLQQVTHDFPVRLATGGKEIPWPECGIKEANHLINNFRTMGDSLSEQFNEVKKINEELEQRVDERTNQLSKALHNLNIIMENTQIGIFKTIDRRPVWFNQKIEEMFQYSKEEMMSQTTRIFYPSDEAYKKLGQEAYPALAQGLVFETNQELTRKDGARIQVRYVGKAVDPQDMSKGTIWLLEDVTERFKAAEKIKILASLIDIAPVLITVHDLDGNFLYANQTAFDLHGYSKEEFLALNVQEVDVPESARLFASRIQQLLENKTLFFDVSHYRKDGTIIPLMASARLSEWDGEKVVFSVCSDITERKQAEEKIKEQQDFLQKALDALTHPFYIIDANDYTIKLSNKASHFGEYREGTKCFQLTHNRSEPCGGDDHPCSLLEVKRTKQPVIIEHIHTDQNWKKRNVEIHAYPVFDSNGNLTEIIEYSLDITERKREEEERRRLVTAIEQGVDSVVITDRDGIIQYVNPSFEKISGYTQDEVIGKNLRISQSGNYDALFSQEILMILASGKAWQGHLINKKKDGTLLEEEVSITPVLNEAGEVVNYVAVKRDVTEQIKLEEQLRQSQKMAAIGTLAGGIAHDFNNILSAILGYSELAKKTLPPGSAAIKDIDQIITSGERAAALVQQILNISRKTEQKLQPLQPHLIVQEVLQMLRSTLPTTVEIQTDLDPASGTIMADKTKLHQVVMNLCTNAFQALKDGNGTLRVTLSRQGMTAKDGEKDKGSPAPFIILSVSDTGQGMDPETVSHIFDPYFTTKGQGSTKGTGLGLAMVHGIIEGYNGFIEVESEPGHGSTFRVFIPAVEENTATLEKSEKEKPLPVGIGTERILVVDDEPLLVRINTRILEDYGYTVTGVTDSLEALEKVRADSKQFDLIITDQTMPGLTGSELAKAVLEITPLMPIIICTGHSEVTSAEESLAMGIKKYLYKPVQGDELVRTVRMVLDEL